MVKMHVSGGTEPAHSVDLDREDVLVGNAPPADVVLPGGGPFQPYALLWRSPEGWRVRDLGSSLGVVVEGPTGPTRLGVVSRLVDVGDTLVLGPHRLAFGVGAAAPAPGGEPPLSPSARLTQFSRDHQEGFRPHLEVFEAGTTTPRQVPLTKEPVLFGSDPGCHVRMTGVTVPGFVAAVETSGERVTLRRVSGGLLAPKVTLDGEPIKDDVTLKDGTRFHVGGVVVFTRLRRR
jgi:hypothetical protein